MVVELENFVVVGSFGSRKVLVCIRMENWIVYEI